MNESFQDFTKEELKVLDATRKIRDNEVLKYVVAAFDRLSTALLVVGFLGADRRYDHKPVAFPAL